MKTAKQEGYDLIGKKVVVFEFGEPRVKNVIGYNEFTNQYQLQTEGKFGYYWTNPERFLAWYHIYWHYIQEAAYEADRLSIKATIMNSK